MTVENLSVLAESHIVLHGGLETAQLWTELRLAQPHIAKTRDALSKIAGYFARSVVNSIRISASEANIVPLVVMRGGVVFLNAIWQELPGCPLGFVVPVRSENPQRLEIVYAEMPLVSSAHYVIFDLIANSGDTIEQVLQGISKAKATGFPEPLAVHVAAPFSTLSVASRLKATFPGIVLHTIWNGLHRRANGWLAGIDFDAGNLAFGAQRRFRTVSGRCIDAPRPPEPSHSFRKVAGLVRDGNRILVVRKNVPGRTEFIMPGGRSEAGESQEETLRREIVEELGVEIDGIKWFGWFEDQATFEGVPMEMDVYDVQLRGSPQPASEIVEIRWIDQNYQQEGIAVGNLLKNSVLPALQRVTAL